VRRCWCLRYRAPDAAQRCFSGALLVRGPCSRSLVGPGSAERHFVPHRVRDTRTGRHTFAFPRHDLPGLRKFDVPLKSEGAGNAGRRCTRALVCRKAKRTHTSRSQVQPNTSGIPRAMFDDLFRALLGVPGVLVTVARAACRAEGRHRHFASLTPASGCRDHTASSDASRASSCASFASIAPRLTFRDDWP
jgi:hypothetical protein